MPPCLQPPNMQTWAPIERNVLVENGHQSNIPYFGDDVIERDHKFINGLVEEVGGIYNQNSGREYCSAQLCV